MKPWWLVPFYSDFFYKNGLNSAAWIQAWRTQEHIQNVSASVCLRSDSGWKPSCPSAQNWAGLRSMWVAPPPAPLQPWLICRRSTMSSRSCKWTTTATTTGCPSSQTLWLSMERWGKGAKRPKDGTTVITMSYRRDTGGAAVINRLLPLCEILPPHHLHIARGPTRYKNSFHTSCFFFFFFLKPIHL